MPPTLGKLLVVDDNPDVLTAARLLLKQHAQAVHTESRPGSIPDLLENGSYDIILLDMNFDRDATSGSEGFQWLQRILEIDPGAVVILMTAYGDVEVAVRAIKEGATDFVLKPWQNEKLLATLSSAMRLRSSRVEIDRLRDRQKGLAEALEGPFYDLLGVSPSMRQVFQLIERVAETDANVLILGENGTGKELVARALHKRSTRQDEAFVSVDMGAISETLFESELFGHVKGAFTDARQDRVGRFEIAHGGTLFLDEIGNLPLPLQPKLLAVLERRQLTRVGSNQPIPIDVRLVCASNMPLHDLISQNAFREDLLYRINTVEIHLPPLRERTEDISLLADDFLASYARKYGKSIEGIAPAAMDKLTRYRWPGNVRELRHAVERAVIMSDGATLQPDDFLLSPMTSVEGDGLSFTDYNLESVEKTVIRKAIEKHDGNISHAARELGLTRGALYRRLEKYGL